MIPWTLQRASDTLQLLDPDGSEIESITIDAVLDLVLEHLHDGDTINYTVKQ